MRNPAQHEHQVYRAFSHDLIGVRSGQSRSVSRFEPELKSPAASAHATTPSVESADVGSTLGGIVDWTFAVV
jgi:hypothetical protein